MAADKFIREKKVTIGGEDVEIRRLPLAAGLKLAELISGTLTPEFVAILQDKNADKISLIKEVLIKLPEFVELLVKYGVVDKEADWLERDWNLGIELSASILDFNTDESEVMDPLLRAIQAALPAAFEEIATA